jgi:nitrile hydratase accessory protein
MTLALDEVGPAPPPRQNGELVFAAPWEREVFGITMALYEAGLFAWDEFRALLIAELQASPAYYRAWARALECLLDEKGLLSSTELTERAQAFARRPHGHDHE